MILSPTPPKSPNSGSGQVWREGGASSPLFLDKGIPTLLDKIEGLLAKQDMVPSGL